MAEPHLFTTISFGSALAIGDDYREDEVAVIAIRLLAERSKKKKGGRTTDANMAFS
jgi:hypothetical protein